MFCISSPNCKVFAQIIHTLAKIGDEVLFEPRARSLVLKTKNLAESSYAETELQANFFSSFSFNPTLYQEDTINFKVTVRSLVSVVKSPHSFDKNVDTCLLRYEQGKFQLTVIISYSKGTTKEFIIPHIEYESFEANFSKADAKNYMLSDACTLMSAANQFKSGEDEITLSCGKENSILENYLQNAKDCKTTVKTTVRVDHQYLETYSINFPTAITFCLKEFKALLMLADNVRAPIAFYFDSPGKPLTLEVSEQGIFRINVLISTLQASTSDQQQSSQTPPASLASQSGQSNCDDNRQSAQVISTKNIPNSVAPPASSILQNQSKANPIRVQNNIRDSDRFAYNFPIPTTSLNRQGSQNLSQNNGLVRSQNCDSSQRGHNKFHSNGNNDQNDMHDPSQTNTSYNQNDDLIRSQRRTHDLSQNNENVSHKNSHNAVQSNEPNNPVSSQPQNLDEAENFVPNDFILDPNDFAGDDFNLDEEPKSSKRCSDIEPPQSTKHPRKRRREPENNNTLEDIEAFVKEKRSSVNSEALNSKFDEVNHSRMKILHDPVNQLILNVFRWFFNPAKSWKKNRSKVIVYDSDGFTDSD
nr:PREDICTED: cell cycle checkpoint control protein RAD9B [Bemisia tabaci]XP_018900660.1 PREDICTED: cell cycle checkpoint control protein RAD9B [Bemisia tabaci]